jgi:hypothetical protein
MAFATYIDATEIHFHSVDPGRQGRIQFDGVEHQEQFDMFLFR